MAIITADGAEDYKASIQALLKTIEANEVGKVLLRGIYSANVLQYLIVLPHKGDAYKGYCDAVTQPQNPYGAYPKGVRPNPNANSSSTKGAFTGSEDRYEQEPAGFVGTGFGSSSHIEFSPEYWGPSKTSCFQGENGSLPDEVLFHEMIHGLRNLQGVRNPWPTEDNGYGNEEEFLAIVATNVYISAKGSTQLRRNADEHWPLNAPLNTSAGFLKEPRNLRILKIHRLLWIPTFGDLAHVVTANFNPFRELWQQG